MKKYRAILPNGHVEFLARADAEKLGVEIVELPYEPPPEEKPLGPGRLALLEIALKEKGVISDADLTAARETR